MRKIFFTILISIVSLTLLSQKVSVQVTKAKNVAVSEWQILDEQYNSVLSGNEFSDKDSVSFFLEANRRYLFGISVSDVYSQDTSLYCLFINYEPVLLINADLGTGDHFYPFFTGIRHDQSKITGGSNADISDYPWQVFYESGSYTCGGSIISEDWIITAAHCTEDDRGNAIPLSAMAVVVGANNPRTGLEGKKYAVSNVIINENYDRNTLNNDIALLKLETAIDYQNATPIRLISKIDSATGATDPGVMSWVTGYGLTKAYPPAIPTTLQKVQLPLVTNSQASTVWEVIPPSDMMAGYHSGNKDACSGDSGGPLVVPVDNEFKLAGIVSWGRSTCDTYGAYTRVSIFESWINSKTGIEISYMPPVPSGDSIICQGVVTSQYVVGTIEGTTSYEWQLLPAEAGTIQGNSEQAAVTWVQGYTGAATIKLRVTKYNIVSYWSALTVHIAEYNRLVSQSNDTIICAAQPFILKVVSEGYNLNYSWFKDGNFIKSGDSPELSFSNATKDSSGIYRCDINGSCGEDLSPEINLTVLPVTVIKNITPDTEAAFGDDIELEVNADGHNLLYQWQKDGNNISGGTASLLAINDVNASNTGLYRVMVSGSCGEVPSNNVYLYVTNTENHTDPEIFVWPTLVNSDFYVALSDDREYDLMLFNSGGKLIKEIRNCRFKTNLNISNFPRGVYIITVRGNNFHKSIKLIRN